MVIHSSGATLWFRRHLGGVVLAHCHNVTFRGFAIDRDPPPFAVAVEVGKAGAVFEIPAGFATSLAPWWHTGSGAFRQPLSYHY
eukprot:gene47419-47706_t